MKFGEFKNGAKIQLLRSKYDPIKKRSSQTMIASFDQRSEILPLEIISKLTEEEILQVEAYMKPLNDERTHSWEKSILSMTGSSIKGGADVLKNESLELTDDYARELLTSMKSLQKQLRKRGYTHTSIKQ